MGRVEATRNSELPVFVRGRLSPRGVEQMRRLFALLYRLACRVEIRGVERVPPGGVIISPNHLSRFDPPLIFISLPNRKATVFNADTYRSRPFFRFIMEMNDVIWVNRAATSPSTMKHAVRVLREGSVLGVAPEGTRSKTGALQPGKTGAAFLGFVSGAPIVPAAITNTDQVARALRSFKRVTLTLTYGEPLILAAPGERARPTAQQLDEATTELMCRIAAMLPPRYRGVYAEHPRTLELLAAAPAPAQP
jgi:1-acyl-sn-glycerol-3-phosphate acyltransferase